MRAICKYLTCHQLLKGSDLFYVNLKGHNQKIDVKAKGE